MTSPTSEPDEERRGTQWRPSPEAEARDRLQSGEPPLLVQSWLEEQRWSEARARELVEEVEAQWEHNAPGKLGTYFGFHRRIGRGEFWVSNIIGLVITIGAAAASGPTGLWWLFYPPFAVVILMSASATVRRLHDRGHTGWLAWVVLIPVIGLYWGIPLAFMSGDDDANSYGEAPEGTRVGVVGGRPRMSRLNRTLDMESKFASLQERFRRRELSREDYQAEVNRLVAYPPDLERGTVAAIRQAVREDIKPQGGGRGSP